MDVDAELSRHFAPHGKAVEPEVMGELQSILRLHSISPQELFYKWESYCIKMGGEPLTLDLKTSRNLKKDIQDALERETRGKVQSRSVDKRHVGATPRNARRGAGDDVFGMMEGVVQTPRAPMNAVNGNSVKRRNDFETPASKVGKAHPGSSPADNRGISSTKSLDLGSSNVAFSERTNSGDIMETLNGVIDVPSAPQVPVLEPRIKLKANVEVNKFAYKPMATKLTEASEVLDDRIDEFLLLLQDHYKLDDRDFGNPTVQSTSEIVAVGRIASDSDGKLNSASIVLETSRRTGSGVRVPLKLDAVEGYDFFPGKIVALKGSNASGEYFTVSEVMALPLLPSAASSFQDLEVFRSKMESSTDDDSGSPRPLNIIAGAGPYTTDSNLNFEALQALCERAINTAADALVLVGPFIDVEHPLVAAGNLPELPSSLNVNADTATLADVFRAFISLPLQRLAQSLPGLVIVMVPSVRDAINKHVSWPQDKMNKKELGLPKQCVMVPNPMIISLNEIVIGISSEDALYELKREECVSGKLPEEKANVLARLSRYLIEQRHFFPLLPSTARDNLPKPAMPDGQKQAEVKAVGAMIDTSYLALGSWPKVKPDILITPSLLAPCIRVVEGVTVINPGTLMKRRGPGSFTQMHVKALEIGDAERETDTAVPNKVFERARIDIVRI